jgi:hypothetical protein
MVQDGVEWFGAASGNVAVALSQYLAKMAPLSLRETFLPRWLQVTPYILGSQFPAENNTWGFNVSCCRKLSHQVSNMPSASQSPRLRLVITACNEK